MTIKDEKGVEPEIAVFSVEPIVTQEDQGNPIPAQHSRFYCEKCHTVSRESCLLPCAISNSHDSFACCRSHMISLTEQRAGDAPTA